MTAQRLKQLYYLPREIRQAQGELGLLRRMSPLPDENEGQARELRQQVERLEEEYRALSDYIEGIPDSATRLIFTLRYRQRMQWAQIAARIGGGNTADGVRKVHARYLQK